MYPYLLLIVVDGFCITTRHKSYGEALVMQLELEAEYGDRIRINLRYKESLEAIKW